MTERSVDVVPRTSLEVLRARTKPLVPASRRCCDGIRASRDSQIATLHSQCRHAFVGNSGVPQIQLAQMFESRQRFETRIGHARAVQVEVSQLRQRCKLTYPGVAEG